jgi:hypothetical protein
MDVHSCGEGGDRLGRRRAPFGFFLYRTSSLYVCSEERPHRLALRQHELRARQLHASLFLPLFWRPPSYLPLPFWRTSQAMLVSREVRGAVVPVDRCVLEHSCVWGGAGGALSLSLSRAHPLCCAGNGFITHCILSPPPPSNNSFGVPCDSATLAAAPCTCFGTCFLRHHYFAYVGSCGW